MKYERQFFIGYDSKTPEPYHVCRQSLIDVGVDPKIILPLDLEMFKVAGWYYRDPNAKASTEFTYTRFLVPFMSGYYGQSIFCDADFLWRKNPEILFDFAADHYTDFAVHVVQHEIEPSQISDVKMDGKAQSWYPRKNWSSLMVFNNAHLDCLNLTPRNVSEQSADWLHQFKWTSKIGPLPKTFNYLVGYGYDVKDPYAVHFTDGGPWLGGQYENVEYASEWFRVQQETKRVLY